ncbi:hypothetical protein CARUB_v10012596mg [Capsella rubella]|uniref:Thaumatin-like protein n=1 Tax=Capsella rubella TaxID=81985 RepID=R0GP83_9BRAS|nr:hypothetical protein CARUB_v10012596mg [Capsella rubella]
MAISSRVHLLFFPFIIATFLINLLLQGAISIVSGTVFTITNGCSYTVWPEILTSSGPQIGDGGFALPTGSSTTFTASPGDCGGKLKCGGAGGSPPATLAEFTIGSTGRKLNAVLQDFYDVSLVDGYNVQMKVTAQGGSGNCQTAGCVSDVNAICPNELRVTGEGGVVACKSACEAFNKPEYCCTGAFNKPETCPPTSYSKIFKGACPTAYSYAYDDASSTFTCTNANYLISFCP